MKKADLTKLEEIIFMHKSNGTDMLFRNTFSIACQLSMAGKKRSAEKLLLSLFDWLGWATRKTYFQSIYDSLHQHAEDYAWEIQANCEINEILLEKENG